MAITMDLYMSLCDYLKGFTEAPFSLLQAVDLMIQIAESVAHFHGMNVVDGDFKSGNILVQVVDPEFQGDTRAEETTSLTVKIADFGLSSKVKNDSTSDLGTTRWMAPEAPNSRTSDDRPSDRFHPKKLDVYSFGIICYEILSGKEPFAGVPFEEVAPRVRVGLRPSLPDEIPGRLASLIQECWSEDPQLRPGFAAICTELRFTKELSCEIWDVRSYYKDRNYTKCLCHNFEEDVSLGSDLDLKSVKVQGPWGSPGNDGREFCDGIFTFLKRIVVHFGKRPTNIFYMELEYDINGTSFVVQHGEESYGDIRETINIDAPSEYLAQIEGSFGTSTSLENQTGVQTLTFHTNKKTYGPFGREKETGVGETKFKSDYGRIVGFFGKKHDYWFDQIGCLVVRGTTTSPTL